MPDRGMQSSGGSASRADRTERLSRAIDRLIEGHHDPALDDPDLQDLVQLAGRLRAELPIDLPDPGFRVALKRQLTEPRVPSSSPRQLRPWWNAPYIPAVTAIAAVLVVVAVGSLSFWNNESDSNDAVDELVAVASQPVTMAAIIEATSPAPEEESVPSVAAATDSMALSQRTPETVAEGSMTATPVFNATIAPLSTATSSAPQVALTSIPPVDAQHVQLGPGPAVSGFGSGPADDVVATLATAMPDMSETATIYELTPPDIDPVELVSRVAAAIGIEGEVRYGENAFGGTDYFVQSSAGDTFVWTPETGAFSYYAAPAESGAPVPPEVMSVIPGRWLEEIGYPVQQLKLLNDPERRFDDAVQTTAVLDDLPQPAVGHPVGVTVVVASDGRVVEVNGYWLNLVRSIEAPLGEASDAWAAIERGEGLWFDGGISSAGGEFHADSVQLSYVVTKGEGATLALQPVVRADGEFAAHDGTSSRISVFVQATEPNNP